MKYGLIGKTLSYSCSPKIHSLFGNSEYTLLELSEEELADFFIKKDFLGINVTNPYKVSCMQYLDVISPEAERIGCVNTVLNENGKLIGFNTDYFGIKELIDYNGIDVEDKRVLILGTGATAKTARTAAEDLGSSAIHILGRTSGHRMPDAAVVINATPCGTWPNIFEHVDIDDVLFPEAVVDVVYNPIRSDLVMWAKEKGISSVGGLYMLISQASYSHELFTGEKISREKAAKAYGKILFERENIVLTGMPSCGKSLIGNIIASKMGRDYVDTDRLTEEIAGKKACDIIREDGEEVFRAYESEAVKKASAMWGKVIATGGGTVLFPENISNLRKNGRIFFIDRPLNLLSPSEDRPLSDSPEKLSALFEDRYDTYLNTCDDRIECGKIAFMAADSVIEEFNEHIKAEEGVYL